MRKSPHVSFQVDSIDNLANWRSVLLHGKFEELKDNKEQQRAMVMIQDRIKPFVASESTKPYGFSKAPQVVEKPYRTIVYRIKIETESGRFEKSASE